MPSTTVAVHLPEFDAKAKEAALPTSAVGQADDVIKVIDDVLVDPRAYIDYIRTLPFQSVTVGPIVFHGIAECQNETLPLLIRQMQPDLVPGLTFFRRSPYGQEEPNFIHTDRDMGDWTAILYLNPEPAAGDGTTFWRHRETGATVSTASTQEDVMAEWVAWRDLDVWEPWKTVEAKLGRLLMFSAPFFHSRALPDNYGSGDSARLIQLVFGTGRLGA